VIRTGDDDATMLRNKCFENAFYEESVPTPAFVNFSHNKYTYILCEAHTGIGTNRISIVADAYDFTYVKYVEPYVFALHYEEISEMESRVLFRSV
jgi:hypothetical protein